MEIIKIRKDIPGKIAILAVLAFIPRVAAILILGRHINPEAWEYDVMALNILSGKGHVFNYLGTDHYFFGSSPLYVYFELLIHYLTNSNYFILELVQAAVASLVIIPLFNLAKYLFNEKTATIAGLLYCLHPGLIVYATKIHELSLVVLFIVIIMYLLTCCVHKPGHFFAASILTGLGVLLRPTMIFIIPCYAVYLLVKREHLSRIIARSLTIVLSVVVCISPWVYRGYKIYDRFIFVTTTSAEHLWRGNSPLSSGTSLDIDGRNMIELSGADFQRRLSGLDEIGQRDLFKSEALRYIKNDPALFFKNTVKKFIYFWSFAPQTGVLYPGEWLLPYQILYGVMSSFFLIGIYFIRRNNIDPAPLVFLFLFFMTVSLANSIFYIEIRHRWMIEPLTMMISAYGIHIFFQLVNLRRKTR
ncbi:MAG: glycosyltransferase family 39 protein [Candidatus Omnitrophica bacterium]|nr:glycosyltransferase family 39 protein [Candidatus Omnitrophota bacterium]